MIYSFHSTCKITAKGEQNPTLTFWAREMSFPTIRCQPQKSEATLTFAQAEVFFGKGVDPIWIRSDGHPRPNPVVYMDVSERIVGFSRQIIPLKNRGFSIITHHPFWGFSPQFLETPIYRSSVPSKLPGFQSYMAEVLGPTGFVSALKSRKFSGRFFWGTKNASSKGL